MLTCLFFSATVCHSKKRSISLDNLEQFNRPQNIFPKPERQTSLLSASPSVVFKLKGISNLQDYLFPQYSVYLPDTFSCFVMYYNHTHQSNNLPFMLPNHPESVYMN